MIPRPVSITRGKSRTGFVHSSAMLTESSKPTMAKKASEVAAVSAMKADFSSEDLKIITSEKSARPSLIAQKPTRMIIRRPESSTMVRTTLAFTLSPTPRRLIAATNAMKPSASRSRPELPASNPRPKPSERKPAKAFEAVEAEVIPEHITVNATRNVRKWSPNARCV